MNFLYFQREEEDKERGRERERREGDKEGEKHKNSLNTRQVILIDRRSFNKNSRILT